MKWSPNDSGVFGVVKIVARKQSISHPAAMGTDSGDIYVMDYGNRKFKNIIETEKSQLLLEADGNRTTMI